jgi:lipopolysaccharide/colanic/teichoic acid biosynthesis glycosyltransferase
VTITASMPQPAVERRGRWLLRLSDIFVASVALVILAPLIIVVAIAILHESGAPVFFRQRRLGQGGRHFLILKFRKFRNDADPSGPHLTSRDDDRMTRIGTLLQRTKVDEIPQFINVLRGEMTIVGPRPESLRFADCFCGRFDEVLSFKPGILGPNQVLFRHEDALLAGRPDVEAYYRQILFPLKASVDLLYFSQRSFSGDMRLLVGAMGAICGFRIRAEDLILSRASRRGCAAGARLSGARLGPQGFPNGRSNQADLDPSGVAP